MGRSITFERHTVLEKSLALFWSRGFAAASLRQLEEVTELNPGSLYYHFTNKEQLFLASLKHYIECHLQPRIERHLNSRKPLEGLRRFFTSGYRHAPDEQYKNCCFLACTTSDLHLLPSLAAELICSGLDAIQSGFKNHLKQATEKELVDSQHSTEELAQEFCHLYLSIQLMAKLRPNQHQLDTIIRQSLATLLNPKAFH